MLFASFPKAGGVGNGEKRGWRLVPWLIQERSWKERGQLCPRDPSSTDSRTRLYKAVRAPADGRFMAPMRDLELVEALSMNRR
jgi:hypothetical protein